MRFLLLFLFFISCYHREYEEIEIPKKQKVDFFISLKRECLEVAKLKWTKVDEAEEYDIIYGCSACYKQYVDNNTCYYQYHYLATTKERSYEKTISKRECLWYKFIVIAMAGGKEIKRTYRRECTVDEKYLPYYYPDEIKDDPELTD